MVFVPATILDGLPVVAEVWFSGPDYDGKYDAGCDGLYWRKRDGTKGKELSQAMMDKVEKSDGWWQADVTEQANEWLGEHCPTKRYVGGPANFAEGIDHAGYVTEGQYSEEYLSLNPRR